jgi:hypothetical protein
MIVFLLLFTLLLSQTVSTAPGADTEDDIREAVIRYMFEHSATQQHPYASTIFIALERDKDPSDEFMKRFEGNRPIVKKLSGSTYTSDTGMIVDKETGRGGIRYNVGTIKWINEKEARVEASYYVAMLFAGGCQYRIVQERRKWVVKGCEGGHWES